MSNRCRNRVASGTIVWDKFDQIFYVAKGGSDSNDGENIENPKLTIGSALTAAAAKTPSAVNRFAIVSLDDGVYTESITCIDYCDIYFPNAKLVGNIIAASSCSIKFREQECIAGSNGIQFTGTGYLNIDIDTITAITALTWVYINDSGAFTSRTNIKFKLLNLPASSVGVHSVSSGSIHIEGDQIFMTGESNTCIHHVDSADGITGHIGFILGDSSQSSVFLINDGGEPSLTVDHIHDVDTALVINDGEAYLSTNYIYATYPYAIANSGELYLMCDRIASAFEGTVTAGGVVNLIEAGKGITTTDTSFSLDSPFNSTDSPALSFKGDNAGAEVEGSVYLVTGVDPHLRISVDDDGTSPTLTAVMDIYDDALLFPTDNTVDIGASGATRPKDYYGAGNVTAAGAGSFAGITDTTRTQHAVSVYGSGGSLSEIGPLINGQLVVGSTGSSPVATTLTAGAGVTITNAAGSITISASSGGFSWVDASSATYTISVQTGYIVNNGAGVTLTLPATASLGDTIKIVGKSGIWVVAQNANQSIGFGSSTTTVGVGGRLTATDAGDCIEMVCTTAGASTVWRVSSSIGNITVA